MDDNTIINLLDYKAMTMTNRQVAESFANMVNGVRKGDARSSSGGNFSARVDDGGNAYLYSYSTLIAFYEKESQTLVFNVTRYSTTTSTRHQTHFCLIGRRALRVRRTAVVTGCRYRESDLKRYLVDGRYVVQDGWSRGKPLYGVFDTVTESVVRTYQKRFFAERKAKELNEAQALKG